MLLLVVTNGQAQEQLSALEQRLEQIGLDYVKNPKQAWEDLQAIRPALEADSNPELLADWYLTAALVQSTIGNLDDALTLAESGLSRYEALDSHEGLVDSRLVRGNILSAQGRYRESIEEFEHVLANSSGLEDRLEYDGAAWIGLGDAYAVIGDFSQALEALTEAYRIYRELGDDEAISSIFGLLGNIYSDIDASEEAIRMYREAAELDRRLGDDLNIAINLYNIGRARTDLGQTEQARTSYEEALEIVRRVGSRVTEGYIHYGIGLSHAADEQWALARAQLDEAEAILAEVKDDFQVALVRAELAAIDFEQGELIHALDRVRLAAAPLEAIDDEKHLIEVYGLTARIHAALGEHERAYEFAQRRNALMEKFSSEERARRVAQLRVRLDTDRAEDEARALTEENRLKAELLERKRFENRMILSGALVLLVVLVALIYSFGRQKRLEGRLRHLANTDDLTGLISRRRLFQIGEKEIDRAGRYHLPLSAMVLDLDYFKSINDRYGHATGDEVLREIAIYVEQQMRDTDYLGRIGGEEFLALLPHTDRREAMDVAARLVKAVADMDLRMAGVDERLTLSIGVACFQGAGDTLSQMIKRADAALYEAKSDGRNQARAEWMLQA